MNNWKQKSSWLAVAGASLVLAACGGDSSSSDGLSLKPLAYNGVETPASITDNNYEAIAEETHNVVLAMLAGNDLQQFGAGPMGPMSVSKAVADIQAAALAAPAPTGEASGGEEWSSTERVVLDGECGGTVESEFTETEKSTYSEDFRSESSGVSGEDFSVEMSAVFRDYCTYMDDDVTEIVINGKSSGGFSNSEKEDYAAQTRTADGQGKVSGKLSVLVDGEKFTVETASSSRYHADRTKVAIGEDSYRYEYNPDTFIDETYAVVQVSGSGVAGKYTYNETCEVDPEDLSDIDCTDSTVINAGGLNYKIEGGIYSGSINATIYLPEYGSVGVSHAGSVPALCDDYSGFGSGGLSINSGDVTISYSGCAAEPVVTRGGVSEVMVR
ncbi:hypothetical protein [Thalassolituus hydrocarboniclasticus]|uniref:Lipoprotein n=1 Tax=Thalassolituus hydrocarboniclasticus TaxID=2742796 RepID=A0ABY6ACL2_9GAMM|nr:hypothetical protein [Thalassolituus hydrocarboniclasticus]UXD88387.1 hypothetical protein HUF19_13540 [Thalassolituus hydrocarboniclasticus]